MITIILAHPWHGSFNKVILDTLVEKYVKENKAYQIIDLHKDGFQGIYNEKELSHYNTGYTEDKLIKKYQEMIEKTSKIIFIFPIWWGTMPAILKGFFDKVMLINFAFNYNNGWTPLLNIDGGAVITTSQAPTEVFKMPIEYGIIKLMLEAIGIKNIKWHNCDDVSKKENKEKRTHFLEMIKKEVC